MPDDCRKAGYFKVTVQQFKDHAIVENATRQGVPVLVTTLGTEFDEAPFTAKALRQIVKDQNEMVRTNCERPEQNGKSQRHEHSASVLP